MIKKKLVLSVFLLIILGGLPPLASVAQDNAQAQLLFDLANDSLEAGNLNQALVNYHQLENQNQFSGPLFLNMALSYVELDSLGKAKFYFLRASRFDETKDSAEQGLAYVETQFSRQSAALPKLPWEKAVNWLRISIGASTLLGIGIILINLGVIVYIANWFFELPFEKWISHCGIVMLGMGLGITMLSFYVDYVDDRYSDAVMVHNQTNVLEKPAPGASVISQAYEGYSFTVDHYQSSQHKGWNYVRMSNGLYGWIPSEEIMIL